MCPVQLLKLELEVTLPGLASQLGRKLALKGITYLLMGGFHLTIGEGALGIPIAQPEGLLSGFIC